MDSLTENSWNTFTKLLFLPVFLLVYFLNNEIADWHKICTTMQAIQSKIAGYDVCHTTYDLCSDTSPWDSENACACVRAMDLFQHHTHAG